MLLYPIDISGIGGDAIVFSSHQLIDFFSISLLNQFLKMCKYLATTMSYSKRPCNLSFCYVKCFLLFILSLSLAISISELPRTLILFCLILFCFKKKMMHKQLLHF